MSVVDVIDEQNDLRAHTKEFRLWPRQWRRYSGRDTLDWHLLRLDRSERGSVPDEPGIYTLLVQPLVAEHPANSYLVYVGKTVSLNVRFGKYLTTERRVTGRPRVFRMLNQYSNYVWFCFTRIPRAQLRNVEDRLIAAFLPPINRQVPAELQSIVNAW